MLGIGLGMRYPGRVFPFGSSPSIRTVSLLRACLCGILAAAVCGLMALIWMDRAEVREFEALLREARGTAPVADRDADVLSIMSTVNSRLKSIHLPPSTEAEKHELLATVRSSHDHLQSPTGACASYSHVLAKALMTAGYDVRKVGLGKDGQMAIHHVIEVQTGSSWVLMDALYNQVFRAKTGRLADAGAVHDDWAWFRQQVPADYDSRFDYSTYYYTNWSRIPVLGRVIQGIPAIHEWLHRHRVSVRFWFFNTYRWLAILCVLLALAAGWALRRLSRR